jgi:hypothetical protein
MSNEMTETRESASNDVAQLRGKMLGRIDAARSVFLRGQSEVKRQPHELPPALQQYGPALTWSDMTVQTWEKIRCGATGLVILQPAWYLAVLEDSLRVTGPTPWCDPSAHPDMRIMFAGRWVAPDLDALRPRIPAQPPTPKRLGRWRLISGLEILQLRIPRKSCRGPYSVNQDACYVDFRRLKRAKRRHAIH